MTRPSPMVVYASGQIVSLLRKKRVLDEAIAAEARRPAACSVTLQELKRQRLALTEQISRVRGRVRTPLQGRLQ